MLNEQLNIKLITDDYRIIDIEKVLEVNISDIEDILINEISLFDAAFKSDMLLIFKSFLPFLIPNIFKISDKYIFFFLIKNGLLIFI